MTSLPIFGGYLKRDLIQQAYGECGRFSGEFEIEPEEYAAGCRLLDRMMYELRDQQGIDLGYNFPNPGAVGNAMDESGIPYGATGAVVSGLALKLAPTMGKALSGEAKASLARSWQSLFATYVKAPPMAWSRATIAGAGNRRSLFGRRPFLPVDFPVLDGPLVAVDVPTITPSPIVISARLAFNAARNSMYLGAL